MEYNFQADIGADIGDFMKGVKQVDAEIRDLATGVDIDFEADIDDVMKDVKLIEKEISDLTHDDKEIDITSSIHDFMAGAEAVHRQAERLDGWDVRIDINAYILKAQMAISLIETRLRMLTMKDFTVRIKASWNNFRNIMGSIATFQRNIEEVTGTMGRSGLMFLSPAAVPVIASTVGLLGQLGPMLGTILGSSFALATSFGAAGIGAAGFAAVAIPALKGVFDKAGEITDLEMKIADAKAVGDIEKANEHLAEMDRIFKGMSGPQLEAHSALRDFQGTFNELVKDMEPGVVEAFGGSLTGITSVLGLARPMIENVVDSVNNLVDSFNRSLEAQDVKDFFSFLGDFAGPALETIAKAAGNFTMGLFNMMEAFGPLATETQNSFLKMSESFRQWADGLSESEKFQSFVDYISENMPKIRSIFSDAIQGIINTFAAFAPSSADMMSSLQDIMERFKEWSAALGESQGFKNFIDYIQTNGPVVISVIGGLVDFIINLGKALAPVGEYLLNLVDRFLEWSNGMMEAHPWLGKIAGAAFVVAAGLVAIAPAVLLVNAMFGGLILGMLKLVARMTFTAVVWVAKWALMATQSLFQAARMAAAWFIALGPVGWITGIIIGLAILVIANWDKIVAFTKSAWTTISSAITVAVSIIMTWIQEKFPAIYTIIQSYMTAAGEIISVVWEYIKGTFSNVLAFLKALVQGDFEGMKTAISNQMELAKATIQRIWDAVKTYVMTVLSTVGGIVRDKFMEMVTNTKEKMDNIKNTVRDKWEEAKNQAREKLEALLTAVREFFERIVTKITEKMGEAVQEVAKFVGQMPGKVLEFVDDMVSAGADLVGGVISGIKSKISEGLGVIGGLASDLISRFKRDTDTHSPSRAFADVSKWFAPGIVRGIEQTSGQAYNAVTSLSEGLTNAFNPQLAMADMNASANLDTSISRADMGVVRKSFAAEIPSVEVAERDIHLSVDGRKFAKLTAKPMQEEMDRNTVQRNASKRGHN